MASPPPDRLSVRVVYAPAGVVRECALDLPEGACVRDAVAASGLLEAFPELAAGPLDLGVFNRPCSPERRLQAGDRIEIYRPLLIDPKAARHLRVAARRKADAQARQAGASAISPLLDAPSSAK